MPNYATFMLITNRYICWGVYSFLWWVCRSIYISSRTSNIQSGFAELINNFGVDIDYFVNTFSLSSANLFYGEEPTAPFYGPTVVRAYIEYENAGNPLQTWGWDAEDNITMYIHIDGFVEALSGSGIHAAKGQLIEPKADDGFILTPFGCDRPGGRGPKHFVVTEAIDEDGSTLNPLMGHYIWKITAKRHDFSYEAGFGPENEAQVYDNTFSGVLSSDITLLDQLSTTQLSSAPKSYDFDVDEEVNEKIFDTSINDTSIYGDYY